MSATPEGKRASASNARHLREARASLIPSLIPHPCVLNLAAREPVFHQYFMC